MVSNRIVRNNIVKNAIGAYAGCEAYSYEAFGKATAVYLDGDSNHTIVENNTLKTGEWGGIYINGNSDNQIINNNVSGFNEQIYFAVSSTSSGDIRNIVVTGNKFIAEGTQFSMRIKLLANDDINLFGLFANNQYNKIGSNLTISINRDYSGGGGTTNMTLAEWKAVYGLDAGSISNPKKLMSNGKVMKINGKVLVASR